MKEFCDQHMKSVETSATVAAELKAIRVLYENEAASSKEHRLESVPIRECVSHHTYQIKDLETAVDKVDKKVDAQGKTLRWGFVYGGIIGGVIGALVGSGMTEVLVKFVTWLMRRT